MNQTAQLGPSSSALDPSIPDLSIPEPSTPSASAWCHHQLVYHGDQDLALRQVVTSTVGELVRSGTIDRFFFIRYELGGPHLRLRWRRTGKRREIESILDDRAREFFARHPSTQSWSPDTIRQANRQIRGLESLQPEEDPVFADQSWHRAPLQFEVERYGGPRHFDPATDLFMLSSLRALHAIDGIPRNGTFQTRVVAEILLSAFAFGLDRAEVLDLAGYATAFFGDRFATCRAEAEARFDDLRSPLVALAERCADSVAEAFDQHGETTDDADARVDTLLDVAYVDAARRASQALDDAPSRRRYTLGSHIHMSANRLGMLNPEEAYLSHLAYLAVRELDHDAVAVPARAPLAAAGDPGRILHRWAERVAEPIGEGTAS